MAYLNVFINNSNKNPINVNRDTKPVPPGPGIVVEEIPTKQSVPTKQNDGFTEQDLIDYVLENLITQ